MANLLVMGAEGLGRLLEITANIESSYRIFFRKDLSAWKKVCGIVPRLLGFATNSTILINLNQPIDGLRIASSAINRIITPLTDIPLQQKKQSYIPSILQVASGAANLADDLRIFQPPRELFYLNEQLYKSEATKTALVYLYQKIKSNPSAITENKEVLNYLEQIQTNYPVPIIQTSINSHIQILAGTSAADLRVIPYCFCHKETFTKRTCKILKYPVREAVVVGKTSITPPVYYEFLFLLGWYKHEEGPPKGWPKSIPFNRNAIVIDEEETAQITKDLQKELDLVDAECVKSQLDAMELVLKELCPKKEPSCCQ